jgi:hypothetical protein
MKNRADRHREHRWERRQARLHREREQAATEMAQMTHAFDMNCAVADAIVWEALGMMAGEKRSRHDSAINLSGASPQGGEGK